MDIATTYPNFVLVADLTYAYIQSLLTRVGWQDVTAQNLDWQSAYVFQDVDGRLTSANNLDQARMLLINAYVLMTNS